MHPIKLVTLGLQRVKGEEKNQSIGDMQRRGAKRDMQRKGREGYAEKGKGGLNGGRDMQRRGAKEREGYAEKGKGG